jgi:hypothetical protein
MGTNLLPCWKELKECPKWEEGYAAYKKTLLGSKHAKDSTVIDLNRATPTSSTGTKASEEGARQPSKN